MSKPVMTDTGSKAQARQDIERCGWTLQPVEPVYNDTEPDHSIPYDGCPCGDAFCGGCEVPR